MISIIVTAYKSANYIEECLDSIQNQSYFKNNEYEILVGVDGCRKTLEVLDRIKYNYKNLHILYMPENKGTYVTSNTLLYETKGDYVLRFDSDDVMKEDLIERMVENIKGYDFVLPLFIECNENLEVIPNTPQGGGDGILFIKKDLLLKFGGWQGWSCAADTELIMRMRQHNYKQNKLPDAFYRRNHQNQLTRKNNTKHGSNIRENYIKEIQINVYKKQLLKIEPIKNKFIKIT